MGSKKTRWPIQLGNWSPLRSCVLKTTVAVRILNYKRIKYNKSVKHKIKKTPKKQKLHLKKPKML